MDEIQAILARIESDLISDRSRIDNIIVKIDTLSSKIDQLYERMPRMETKIKDAVHDGMIEVSTPLNDMVDKFKVKAKIVKQEKFSLLNFLSRRKVS